jgi:hypothetical protein
MPSDKASELLDILYSHDDTQQTDTARRRTTTVISPNTDGVPTVRPEEEVLTKSKHNSSDGLTQIKINLQQDHLLLD